MSTIVSDSHSTAPFSLAKAWRPAASPLRRTAGHPQSPLSGAARFLRTALSRIATWIAVAHAARLERAALRQIIELDDYLLKDIGLCRHDVAMMIEGPNPARR
jgi:uncharacterized protein YjiS (DUF1127 family)